MTGRLPSLGTYFPPRELPLVESNQAFICASRGPGDRKTSGVGEQETSGPGDRRTRIPEGTSGPQDQRTRRPEDWGTSGFLVANEKNFASRSYSGASDQRTKGPGDQRTSGPEDQRTSGPEDQRTKGPYYQRPQGQESSRRGLSRNMCFFIRFLFLC